MRNKITGLSPSTFSHVRPIKLELALGDGKSKKQFWKKKFRKQFHGGNLDGAKTFNFLGWSKMTWRWFSYHVKTGGKY